MFGLSLSKLIFTALVIVAVWRAFKFVQGLRDRRATAYGPRGTPRARRDGRPLELEPCPLCGTYVPRGGTRCRSTEECLFREPPGPPARTA